MISWIEDERFHFRAAFEDEKGIYYRSGILEQGQDTGEEPFRASFPHLLDIGIMGHCEHGLSGLCQSTGTQCYQSGGELFDENMPLHQYQKIIGQCEGKVFQVALGGRGDPDCHEDFESILDYTRQKGIVPNLTTSGYRLDVNKAKVIRQYCGAAAVSYYRNSYTDRAIDRLVSEGVTTNLHYVLGKNSITEAIEMLEEDRIPQGVTRVIFLLHKPVGMGRQDNVLETRDERVERFFKALKHPSRIDRVGFDSCLVPGVIAYAPEIAVPSFDACEAGRFSGYIDANLHFSPCSFDRTQRWAVDLQKYALEEAWEGEAFSDFRQRFHSVCSWCQQRKICLGGCPLSPEINLCRNLPQD